MSEGAKGFGWMPHLDSRDQLGTGERAAHAAICQQLDEKNIYDSYQDTVNRPLPHSSSAMRPAFFLFFTGVIYL